MPVWIDPAGVGHIHLCRHAERNVERNAVFENPNNARNSKILLGTLIGANASVLVAWKKLPKSQMIRNFCYSKDNVFYRGRWWTFFSSSFSHNTFFHFLSNMVPVWLYGEEFGKKFGPLWLLGTYVSLLHLILIIAGGVGACVFHTMFHPDSPHFITGASGATYALMSALAVTSDSDFNKLFSIRTHMALSVAFEVFGMIFDRDSKVSHAAHIGGAIAGFMIGTSLNERNMEDRFV